MISIEEQNLQFVRLNEDTPISSFDCGDIDLNDFLQNDAKNYLMSMLAVTYLLKIGNEIAAYFCLSYDGLPHFILLIKRIRSTVCGITIISKTPSNPA